MLEKADYLYQLLSKNGDPEILGRDGVYERLLSYEDADRKQKLCKLVCKEIFLLFPKL